MRIFWAAERRRHAYVRRSSRKHRVQVAGAAQPMRCNRRNFDDRTRVAFQRVICADSFASRGAGVGIAVQRDAHRWSALSLQRLAEGRLGRLDIAVGAQSEVDGLAFSIDGAIETCPLAANLT